MPSADIEVFTFKEGVLSPIGHDLKLRATNVQLEVDEQAPSVRVRVEASSLRVICSMREGREVAGGMSELERGEIERSMRR
jgi:hypothetical protein